MSGDKKNPWMKFYPTDWRGDPKLRVCSLGARGLWIEMLSIMHEADPYGYLKIGGVSPSAIQLAALVGATPDATETHLQELENAGVFSYSKSGVIVSRRMVRDENKRRKMRENGKKGGLASASKQKEKSDLVDQKPDLYGKYQRLDTRNIPIQEEEVSYREDTRETEPEPLAGEVFS